MGLWTETCGLTSLPIAPLDPVAMVGFDQSITTLLDNVYTTMEERDKAMLPHIKSIAVGNYDNSGSIDGVEVPAYAIFFHRDAWSAAINIMLPEMQTPEEDPNNWLPLLSHITEQSSYWFFLGEALISLLRFARMARRNVMVGLKYRGCQHDAELEHLLLHELTERILVGKMIQHTFELPGAASNEVVETCGLTGVPITDGDDVVMVGFNHLKASVYHPTCIFDPTMSPDVTLLYQLENIEFGKITDSGTVYDDELFIDDEESLNTRNDFDYTIFFHRQAWGVATRCEANETAALSHFCPDWFNLNSDEGDELLDLYKRTDKREINRSSLSVQDLIRVMALARSTRRDILAGYLYNGSSARHFFAHLALHQITGRILVSKLTEEISELVRF